MMQQKPGTIDIYHLRGENGVVDIAVENCEVISTESKMFFGLASKQITSGEWEVNEYPKLLKPYKYYDFLYEIGVEYAEFGFVMQLLQDSETGGIFIFIYPNTKKRELDRIISDEFSTDPKYSNGLRRSSKVEARMSQCFREGKVCYSDNLTGTDFKHILAAYDFRITV